MNFTRIGKLSVKASCVPFHSTDIARHAVSRVCPSNSPETILQCVPVSHASPSGSATFDFSGNNGANECAPQMRGLKIGSMRSGSGLTVLRRGFSPAEESPQATQTFVDTLNGGGVGKPQIARRPKGFAWHDRYVHSLEQQA